MKIKCPACSKVLSIPDTAAGKIVKCPCGKQLRAPGGTGGAGGTAPAGGSPAAGAAAAQPKAPAARRPARQPASAGDLDPMMFDELTDQDLEPVKAVGSASRAPATPAAGGGKLMDQYAPTDGAGSEPLASVGSRIAGALIDGVFMNVFSGIGAGVAIAYEGPPTETGFTPVQLGILVGFALFAALINAVLISMSGQSIGKKLVGTRIVQKSTGQAAGFVDGVLLRNFVFGILTAIPLIGLFVVIVDVAFLFKDDHETLHDKLAKTRVVKA